MLMECKNSSVCAGRNCFQVILNTESLKISNFIPQNYISMHFATCLLTNFFSQAMWEDRRKTERNQFSPSPSLVKLSLKSIWYRNVYTILNSNSGLEHKRRLKNYEFSRRQEWYIFFLSLRWIIRVILTRVIFLTRNYKNKLTFNVSNKTIYPSIECIQSYLNNCMNWKYRVTATKKRREMKCQIILEVSHWKMFCLSVDDSLFGQNDLKYLNQYTNMYMSLVQFF